MYAFGDRAQLMQAFFNILINAVHASPIGGTVIIRLRTRGGRVLLRVLDHGPGIPQALIGRVCDPFFTTKPQGEGTGLGLALTLGIVEAHKGELTFDSREGEGTRVTMSIPALKRRRQATLPSHPQ
jgi:two-component system NtrC family sensor kinase